MPFSGRTCISYVYVEVFIRNENESLTKQKIEKEAKDKNV